MIIPMYHRLSKTLDIGCGCIGSRRVSDKADSSWCTVRHTGDHRPEYVHSLLDKTRADDRPDTNHKTHDTDEGNRVE